MKWIFEELARAASVLKQGQTWVVIGLLCLFAGLSYWAGTYAFRTDSILLFLHRSVGQCRQLTNGFIISMFCAMIFFAFTVVLTLGELQRYFQFKERSARRQSRSALVWGVGWGCAATSIAVFAILFFQHFCR